MQDAGEGGDIQEGAKNQRGEWRNETKEKGGKGK